MALPVLTSRVAFGYTPDVPVPAYQDMSSRLLTFSSRRGRNYERGQIDAGTANPKYMNKDRALDPFYTSSPYYPNVVPMTRIQHYATWLGIDYHLHTGFVQRWPIAWDGPTWGTTSPAAVDALGALASADLTGTFPQETTGARIARVLDAISWPASVPAGAGYWTLGGGALGTTTNLGYGTAVTSLDTGQATVQAVTIPTDQPVSALQHIQEIADAEPGVFFFDGQGRAVFHDRRHRYTATTAATFSDNPTGGEIQYEDLQPDLDVAKVVNEVIASTTIAAATVTATAQNTASIQRYWRRTEHLTPPLTSLADLQDRANFELVLSATPSPRFDQVTVRPDGQQTAWPTVLGLDVGSKVVVKRTPAGSGITQTIQKTCFVESVQHTVTKTDWTVTFQMSPADAYLAVWTLDTSALDQTTTLVY